MLINGKDKYETDFNYMLRLKHSVEHQLPEGVDENIIDGRDELVQEGKLVCFLLKHGHLISMIGYR